jgi:hypothetical protein
VTEAFNMQDPQTPGENGNVIEFTRPRVWALPMGTPDAAVQVVVNDDHAQVMAEMELHFVQRNRCVQVDLGDGLMMTRNPQIYRNARGETVRVRDEVVDSNGDYKCEMVVVKVSHVGTAANAMRIMPFRRGAGGGVVPGKYGKDLLQEFYDTSSMNAIPLITAVVPPPLLRSDGVVRWHSGYDDMMCVYVSRGGDMDARMDSWWRQWVGHLEAVEAEQGAEAALEESGAAARAAVERIMPLLRVFRYATDSGEVDALGLALTPWITNIINAPVPMGLVFASSVGSGKTELARMIYGIGGLVEGQDWTKTTLHKGTGAEEKLIQRITAAVMDGDRGLLLDNLKVSLDSAALDMLITSSRWSERAYYTQSTVSADWKGLILATLNAPKISADAARRVFPVRMRHAPGEVSGLDIERARTMLRERSESLELQRDVMLIIQHWISSGRPGVSSTGAARAGGMARGSFARWFWCIGGILESVGLEGFGSSGDEIMSLVDIQGDDNVDWLPELVRMVEEARDAGREWASVEHHEGRGLDWNYSTAEGRDLPSGGSREALEATGLRWGCTGEFRAGDLFSFAKMTYERGMGGEDSLWAEMTDMRTVAVFTRWLSNLKDDGFTVYDESSAYRLEKLPRSSSSRSNWRLWWVGTHRSSSSSSSSIGGGIGGGIGNV